MIRARRGERTAFVAQARPAAGGQAAPRLRFARRVHALQGRAGRSRAREGWVHRPAISSAIRGGSPNFSSPSTQVDVPLNHSFRSIKHSIQALIAPDGSRGARHLHAQLPQSAPLEMGRARRRSDVRRDRCRSARAPSPPPGGAARSTSSARRTAAGEMLIHEFNGRFTGATVDRWLLGFDEVGAAIERFTGRPIASRGTAVHRRARGVRIARRARRGSSATSPRLQRDGVWRRAS